MQGRQCHLCFWRAQKVARQGISKRVSRELFVISFDTLLTSIRYVEMLEQQQAQLVTGLRELYRRLQAGEEWPGERLREYHGGHPLTHDILERLDLLHASNDAPIKHEGFDEDLAQLQRRCMRENASPSRRRRSPSEESEPGLTSSESSHGMSSPTQSMSFIESFSQKNSPQTPSLESPFLQPSRTYLPTKSQQYTMPSMNQGGAINPMQLLEAQQWMGTQQSSLEQMDIDAFSYNSPMSYDPQVFNSFPTQNSESTFWADPFNDFIQPNAMLQT
jgi:hypothetical protein